MIVPVGCTGYAAKAIWDKVNKNLSAYYTNVDENLKKAFNKLNDATTSNKDLIENIISFVGLFKDSKHNPANK